MFDTILLATDGSPAADGALRCVRALCERHGSRLCIVHVVRRLGARYLPAAQPYEDRVIAKLKAQTRALRRHGINASLHVIRDAPGSPARHIADTARLVDADLLIVTGRGRSPLRGAVSGSVTQRLLAIAPCPVLVIPAERRTGGRRGVAAEHAGIAA